MINGVKLSPEISDRSTDHKDQGREGECHHHRPVAVDETRAPAPDPDLRLVIAFDEATGDYVYKLIDRATGQVVAERSRDQVAHLAEGPDYRAGTVVSTKA